MQVTIGTARLCNPDMAAVDGRADAVAISDFLKKPSKNFRLQSFGVFDKEPGSVFNAGESRLERANSLQIFGRRNRQRRLVMDHQPVSTAGKPDCKLKNPFALAFLRHIESAPKMHH